MRVFFAVLFAAVVFASPAPLFGQSATAENVGFIPSNIWYSKEPVFAGETIRVYSVLYNSSDKDIAGTIVFLDKDKEIGRTNFSLARGRVQDVWVDWTAEAGEHAITALIRDARAKLSGGEEIPITLANARTGAREAVVETDTDKDGVGDRDDPDLDGDGVANAEELERGTDPEKDDGEEATAEKPPEKENPLAGVKEALPATAVETGKRVFDAIETFRKEEAEKEEGRLEEVRQKIRREAIPGTSEAEGGTGWVSWALLGVHYILLAVLKFQIAFYLAILFGLFYAARFLRRLFGGNRFS